MNRLVLFEIDEQEEFNEGEYLFSVFFPMGWLEQNINHYDYELVHGDCSFIEVESLLDSSEDLWLEFFKEFVFVVYVENWVGVRLL